ncbi:MAG: hypothetical protein ND866_04135 [Pyrinomonadaceae bacterium]|nr:hypothetical protein [Pyrinomonadaceae bacterium]
MNNISIHLSDKDIARYCEQGMAPAELLAADNHLTLCDACYARMGEAHGLDEKLIAASKAFNGAADYEVTHLTYEQLSALVDDRSDDIDREIADSHLALCSRCETELKDLREISSSMAAFPAQQHAPLRRSPSLREKFIALWQLPAFRIPAGAVAALAGIALLAFLITIPLRRENRELRARVTELEGSSAALREQVAAVERLQSEIAAVREENERLQQEATGLDQGLVALNDAGGRITLDTEGNLSGVQTEPRYEEAIKAALQGGRVKFPAELRELRSQSGTLMGGGQPEFKLLAPVGVVIEGDRPTFRWSALEGATGYTVTVYDSSLNQVATSDSLTTTRWTVPTALARGRTYIWQVRAVKDGKEMVAPPPAASRVKFKILEGSKVEEIASAKRTHAKSHLVMGMVYAEAGLLDQAEREFAALLKANPQSSIARKLLQRVRSARQ